jgi:hypothetical protein
MKSFIRWLPRLGVGISALVLALALGRSLWLYLDYMGALIAFPYSVDYGEGPILDQVMRLAHFESLYARDLASPPFRVDNYPPLYHLLQLPFAWAFGPAFWYGRLLNLACILAAACFIALTLHTLTADWLAAGAGGLLLTASPFILHWSGFVRVDSLALALSWAGLFVVVRWPDRPKSLIVAALCLTGAIFTRQSYGLAAPFAAFVWLLSRKPHRQAFELAGWMGVFSAVLFLALNALTQGGFYFHIVSANINPFFWDTVRNYAEQIFENMRFLVLAGAVYLVAAVWTRHSAWWLGSPYLLSSAASAVTIGKDGSNVNYLFELSAAFAFALGAFLNWLGRAWEGTGWRSQVWVGKRWGLLAAGLLLLAYQVLGVYAWSQRDYYRWPMDRVRLEASQIEQMAALVREAQGPVLADEFMGLIPLAGKALAFQPFEFKQLVAGGVWDETPLIDALYDQGYALILLYDPPSWDSRRARWTQAQLDAIERNYIQAGVLAHTRVYVPLDIGDLLK